MPPENQGDDYYAPPDLSAPPSNPWSETELNAARDYYMNFISAQRIPSSWGSASDPLSVYQSMRQQGAPHDAALNNALTYLGWNAPANAPGAGQQSSNTSGGGGGSFGGGGGGMPSGQGLFNPDLYKPFTGAQPGPYAPVALPTVPSFDTYYDVHANPIPVYRGPGMTKK